MPVGLGFGLAGKVLPNVLNLGPMGNRGAFLMGDFLLYCQRQTMRETSAEIAAAAFRRSFSALFFLTAGGLVVWGATRPLPAGADGLVGIGIWRYLIILVAAFSVALLLLAKVRSPIFWGAVFMATLFLGMWYAFLLLLPVGWALLAASALTLLQAFAGRIWAHDLFYLVGLVGLGLSLASWLSPEAVLAGLVGLTAYDIVAGPPRRPILELAQGLVRRGVIPGLAVPGSWSGLTASLAAGIRETSAALLGAGDLAVPLVAVALAARSGPLSGALVLAGVVGGAWLLGSKADLAPRPALPYLALGAGIPFGILYFCGLL